MTKGILFLLVGLIALNVQAKDNSKIESTLLCHKESRFCAVWWKYESKKGSTFWRNRRLKETNLGSVTLNKKEFENQSQFLSEILQKSKPLKYCVSTFIYITKNGTQQSFCDSSLSKSDQNRVHSFFR